MNPLFSFAGKLILAGFIGVIAVFIFLALSPTPSEPIEGFGNFLEILISAFIIGFLTLIALIFRKPAPKIGDTVEKTPSANISDKQMMVAFSALILLPLLFYFLTR